VAVLGFRKNINMTNCNHNGVRLQVWLPQTSASSFHGSG